MALIKIINQRSPFNLFTASWALRMACAGGVLAVLWGAVYWAALLP